MNESSPYRGAGGAELPPPTLYDPAEDPAAPFGLEPEDTVVLLLVGEVDRRWAASAAVEMCTAWAAKGRRVVLADFHLETPLLHEPLEAENLEGVVDVFLYGASIARSARPVPDRGFFLIPAGTYAPDVDAIYGHQRWPKVIAGFRDAGASLVLFAPAATANLRTIADSLNKVVLLGAPAKPDVLAPVTASGTGVRALVVPPDSEPAPYVGSSRPAAPPPAAPAPRTADEGLHLPPPPVRTPHRGDRVMKGALWLLLAVAVVAAIGYAAVSLRPDLMPWAAVGASPAAQSESTATSPAPNLRGPVPAGAPLPYSVRVIAYNSLRAASTPLARLSQEVPAVRFLVSPEEIQGVVYYKVLAGALPDTAQAQRLRGVLVASGAVDEEEAAGAWSLIEHTPLAFDLGEFRTREAAVAASDSLLTADIPSYTLPIPYSDDSERWQLYGGAFADSTAASAMGRLLSAVGVEARLVERKGLPTTRQE